MRTQQPNNIENTARYWETGAKEVLLLADLTAAKLM